MFTWLHSIITKVRDWVSTSSAASSRNAAVVAPPRPLSPVPIPPITPPSIAPVIRPNSPAPIVVPFSSVFGVNGPTTTAAQASSLGVGWVRILASWHDIETHQGGYDWSSVDKAIQWALSSGLTNILLTLAFTPDWASTGDKMSPPKAANLKDWTAFITAVVGRYVQVSHFQIWNEPTKEAGFWRGTDQQFVDLIHIPAASIIRRLDPTAKIVFGGWPSNGGIPRYEALLNYHDCWKYVDYLDLHYYGLDGMTALYPTWIASGKCFGIWQSEIGYVDDKGAYLTQQYPALLTWAKGKWTHPDQFKYFWYSAQGGPPDLAFNDSPVVYTPNGLALQALASKYDGGKANVNE